MYIFLFVTVFYSSTLNCFIIMLLLSRLLMHLHTNNAKHHTLLLLLLLLMYDGLHHFCIFICKCETNAPKYNFLIKHFYTNKAH